MKYHFLSPLTGELQPNLRSVLKAIISDFKNYRYLNIQWKYSRKGF